MVADICIFDIGLIFGAKTVISARYAFLPEVSFQGHETWHVASFGESAGHIGGRYFEFLILG